MNNDIGARRPTGHTNDPGTLMPNCRNCGDLVDHPDESKCKACRRAGTLLRVQRARIQKVDEDLAELGLPTFSELVGGANCLAEAVPITEVTLRLHVVRLQRILRQLPAGVAA